MKKSFEESGVIKMLCMEAQHNDSIHLDDAISNAMYVCLFHGTARALKSAYSVGGADGGVAIKFANIMGEPLLLAILTKETGDEGIDSFSFTFSFDESDIAEGVKVYDFTHPFILPIFIVSAKEDAGMLVSNDSFLPPIIIRAILTLIKFLKDNATDEELVIELPEIASCRVVLDGEVPVITIIPTGIKQIIKHDDDVERKL